MIQYNFLLVSSSRSLFSDRTLLLLFILQLLSHVVTVNTNAISCAHFLQAGLLHFPVLSSSAALWGLSWGLPGFTYLHSAPRPKMLAL